MKEDRHKAAMNAEFCAETAVNAIFLPPHRNVSETAYFKQLRCFYLIFAQFINIF